ncbi:hypothetical protein AB0N07_00190 [Streptomyces sp. NPDC051172]|uniref:hypothetical protein n=1 Tax=Streptomyces sp. NPDC051172 TaxID=3155796 RepID=UPI003447F6A9
MCNSLSERPLLRDPVYDGAADPVAVRNRQAGEWCLIHTSRHATAPGPDAGRVHGPDLAWPPRRSGAAPVSHVPGVPDSWTGPARIRHGTSPDLLARTQPGAPDLDSDRAIDACVYPLPGCGRRMWFKDETLGGHHRMLSDRTPMAPRW